MTNLVLYGRHINVIYNLKCPVGCPLCNTRLPLQRKRIVYVFVSVGMTMSVHFFCNLCVLVKQYKCLCPESIGTKMIRQKILGYSTPWGVVL